MKNALTSISLPSQTALIPLGILLLALGLVITMARSNDGGVQIVTVVFLVFPALLLALTDSKYLLPYVIFVWLVGPELRRIDDWTIGQFQALSLISIAPMLTTLALLIPIFKTSHQIPNALRKPLSLGLIAMLYGVVIGLFHHGFSLIFDLASYVIPVFTLLYIAARPMQTAERDFWIRTIGVFAVGVSLYGWYQYITLPPWDEMWLKTVKNMGTPQPMKFRIFSTLNSFGPAALFLSFALAPMLLERRWRTVFSWAGVLIIASALMLSQVRTVWILTAVVVVVYLVLPPSQGRAEKITGLILIASILFFITPELPGNEAIVLRTNTLSHLQDDNSFQARNGIASGFLPELFANPAGMGLGTVGLASKVENQGQLGQYAAFDNGYYALLFTFGIPGGAAYFGMLWLFFRASVRSMKELIFAPYARLATAIFVSLLVSLLIADNMTGVGGIFLWMYAGCAFAKRRSAIPVPSLMPA